MGILNDRGDEPLVPQARLEDLVISDAGGDVLAYDTEQHEIHHLNHVAWAVLSLCDGLRDIRDIATASGMDQTTVELAIEKLTTAGLVTLPSNGTSTTSRSANRRRFMQIAGGSAAVAAVPVVVSITAPTSMMADSHACAEIDQPCETDDDCCQDVEEDVGCIAGTCQITFF